jgi:hypothetical protein
LAVPVLNGPTSAPIGVITAYGSDPFDNDHRRMLEAAATLFAASVQIQPKAEGAGAAEKAKERGSLIH